MAGAGPAASSRSSVTTAATGRGASGGSRDITGVSVDETVTTGAVEEAVVEAVDGATETMAEEGREEWGGGGGAAVELAGRPKAAVQHHGGVAAPGVEAEGAVGPGSGMA